MKKLMSVLIALFVVALTFGVVACTPIDDSSSSSSSSIDVPEVKLIVTLSESALTLDRYEEGVLTATVTDEEGNPVSEEVTWESDNLSVATVNNGFVEATGVGSANITASVGEASATCVVTVEDTGALPVLNVSDESIELIVGGNYGVDASLTYKRNPVESATITYEILDTAVASVDENGNVTALSFGSTTLRIVASWKGIDPAYLTQEIPVNVKEDVVVEIEQDEAVEIYTSNLQLDGTQFVSTATLTSKVLIAGSSEGVDASRIAWASSNEKVLTVVNGVITAVGEGEAEVTVSYTTDSKTYTSTALKVSVLFPVVEKDVKVYLDASKATILEQVSASEIFGSELAIARIFALGESDDISASATWLKEHDFGSEQERTHKLVVANAEYGYAINALVITKYITTAQELASLQTYSDVTEGSLGTTYYSYGGYFVLANNIVATGEEAPFKAPSMGSIGSVGHATQEAGFHGTFDGQGYTVKGFKFDVGGIFGDIGQGAVIKNVAFEDCDAAWRNFTAAEPARQDGVGVLAANAAGNFLIENVYVESTGNCANGGALIGRSTKGGTIKNSVVIYNATGGWNMGVISSWRVADTKAENVYVIMQGKTTRIFGNGDADTFASDSTYKVVTASEDAAAIEYTNLPAEYWFVAPGMVPVFNSMVKEFVLDQSEVSVDENGEVKLTASLKDIAGGVITNNANWSSSNEEVATVENGALTILGVGNVTITAQIGGYSATCEVEITEAQLPVEDKTSVKLTLEAKNEASLAEQLIAEGVKAGLFASFEVASITDANGEALAENFIATADANNNREATLIVYAADKGYKVNALVITKYIRTAQELASLQSYSVVTEGSNGTKYYSYGGYFVLANNIIATGEEAPFKAPSMGSIGSGGHTTDLAGFHGTFDGQGYVVKGFKFDIGGIFGDIGKDAVIKNVAFEDCNAAWRNFTGNEPARQDGVGVLAANAAGNFLIENVYVESTGNGANAAALVGRTIKGGTIKNSVIIYNATGGWSMGAVSSWRVADTKAENVYVIMQGKTTQIFGNGANESFASGSTFTVVKANEDATAVRYTGLSSDIWFAEPGMVPVFKIMVKELVLDQTEISVDTNGEVKLTASLKDIAGNVISNSANWTSSNDAIATVSNGLLNLLSAGKVTITAEIGGYRATCEVEISEAEMVLVDKTEATLYLETANQASLAEQVVQSGVNAGLFASFEAVSVTDANGEALAENFIASADASNNREATLIVYSANKAYKVKVFVVTKAIRTVAELASLQSYTEVTTGTNAGGATYYSYGGYFVLANNIIATGEEAPLKAPSMGSIGSVGHATDLAGFHGTFDGQGYTVKGIKIDIGGIFGDIGKDAVIKNVAFEDCNAAWRNFTATEPARQDGVGVLAANAAGNFLIENVYLEATGNGANAGGLIGRSTKGGTIKNSVVIYNATGGWNMGVISSWRVADTKAENVYVIMQGKTSRIFGNGDNDTFASGSTFKVVKANEDPTAIEYTNLPEEYWNVEAGKIATFKAKN